MPSSQATPGTKALALGLAGAGAITLSVWSLCELGDPGDDASSKRDAAAADPAASAPRSVARRAGRVRGSVPALAATPATRPDQVTPPPGLGPPVDPQTDGVEAAAMFETALAGLDRRLEKPGKVSHREWTRLYRQSNDALATWSMMLDAQQPEELQILEDARLRLVERLEQLEPRVVPPRRTPMQRR